MLSDTNLVERFAFISQRNDLDHILLLGWCQTNDFAYITREKQHQIVSQK